MLDDCDLRAALKLLQASCLAPYKIGKDRETSKRSVILTLYNLSFMVFIMYNVIHAENDIRNNVDYENKSFLISIALDAVDVLENIHPCFISLRSLIFTKAGLDIWFKINNINQKFKKMNVEFDQRKLKNYMYAKASCFTVISTLVLIADIVLCGKLKIFYTANYWILCGIPLIQNSLMVVGFTGLLLMLYQRFWVINELIRRVTNCTQEAWVDASCERMNYENLSGKYLLVHYLNQSINLKRNQIRNTPKPQKKPPFFAMLKNYESFGRNFYNERNLPRLIRTLKSLHFDLFEVVKDINSIFGWNMLFVFTGAFFGATINMYYVIIYHLTSYYVEEYISCFLWMSVSLLKVIYLITYTANISKEAQQTTDLLHVLMNKIDFNGTPLQVELSSFCLQISQSKVEFKAAEFFVVDRAILFQFVIGVLTNVVFVVQLDKINFSK